MGRHTQLNPTTPQIFKTLTSKHIYVNLIYAGILKSRAIKPLKAFLEGLDSSKPKPIKHPPAQRAH